MLVYVSHTCVYKFVGVSPGVQVDMLVYGCVVNQPGGCYHIGVGVVLVVVHALIPSERHILCLS